ncbi:hypothetical protein SDC9_171150 [bioreactor metagenome]|uniref:Uncharacterized protein n=1 Tax=bioreactor metagenome TaxID=1076179 RepID=A0A645GA24_9ZZZZ
MSGDDFQLRRGFIHEFGTTFGNELVRSAMEAITTNFVLLIKVIG